MSKKIRIACGAHGGSLWSCLSGLVLALVLPAAAAAAQPAGRAPATAEASKAGAGAGKEVAPVAAAVAEDLSRWRYYKVIKIDTSPAGANVKREVKNFPVAVVLKADNFDFAQAKADGSDLRFSRTAKGGALSHAVELWDQAGKSAVVWVKLDSVKGGSRSQSFVMHWGNAEASDAGDSKQVFNTKEGFAGVWHLNEEGSTAEGGYKDASGSEAHMTGVNLKPGSRVDGRVGKGLLLNYPDLQWVKLDNARKKRVFDLTTRGTFSIWAKARSYKNKGNKEQKSLPGYETMFAKGDNSWRLQKFGIRDWHKPPAELIEMCVEQPPNADLCVVGKTDMVPDRWFHVVAVHDFPKAKLFVNGVHEKTDTFDVNWISGDHPVGIGNQSQFPEKGRQWDGWLDEARAMHVAKDEHWIKLDYESQREGSKLLIFGKAQERSSS